MKIYVGNLSYDVSEQELEQAFSEFGTVDSVNIIIDRQTGRSKGFGFIEMSDSDEGKEAVSEMDGKELKGRALKVDEAKEKAASPGGGRGGFGGARRGGGPGGRRFGGGGGGPRGGGNRGGNRGGGRYGDEGGGRDRY